VVSALSEYVAGKEWEKTTPGLKAIYFDHLGERGVFFDVAGQRGHFLESTANVRFADALRNLLENNGLHFASFDLVGQGRLTCIT
jgi:hypothetical protein